MKKMSLIVIFLCVSACAPMRFVHDSSMSKDDESMYVKKWHNTIINGMIEISEPKNLYKICQGRMWKEVKVELNFENGVASVVFNGILEAIFFSWNWFAFYSPWSVGVDCE